MKLRLDIFSPLEPSFGLHLNGTALKFLQLRPAGPGKQELAGFANVPLPKNLMTGDLIVDSKGLAEVITASLRKPQYGHIATNRVVAALPEAKSFVRIIQTPAVPESRAENAIMFEAESYVPVPMDQVYFDWQVISQVGDKMQVLIIASPKDYVDLFLATLEKAKLTVVALEAESQSAARALLLPASQETLLIVDLDAYKTALTLLDKGHLSVTFSFPIAGNTFTEAISRSLGLGLPEAEAVKRKIGMADTAEYPNIKAALQPILTNLAGEIKNVLKFHAEHSSEPISRVLLTGGTAKLQHLAEFLAPELDNLKIEIADPWANLQLVKPPLDRYESLSYTTAIGLALRNIQ